MRDNALRVFRLPQSATLQPASTEFGTTQTNIYRKAIQRAFAVLNSVQPSQSMIVYQRLVKSDMRDHAAGSARR